MSTNRKTQAAPEPTPAPAAAPAPADDIQRQLVRRVAFAGLLIALLLGALALIDHVGRPGGDEVSPPVSGPTFTEPVPVVKKEISGAPAPEAAVPPEALPGEEVEPAAAESAPEQPEVAAQPVLPVVRPHAGGRVTPPSSPLSTRPRAAESALPEGSSAATLPPLRSQPAAESAPAPARLISGYAVQAGVFSDAQRAEELRAMLALNGIPATLEARVQVGPFKTRAEADAARRKMQSLGIDGILLPPKRERR